MHSFHATADNTKIDAHHYDLAKSELDSRIYSDNIDPQQAIVLPVIKASGAEKLLSSAILDENNHHYAQATRALGLALALIPEEASVRTIWHYAGSEVNRSQFMAIIYEHRAYCLLQQRQYEPAISDLSRAIKMHPDYAPNYENRAKAYYLTGQKALGEKDIRALHRLTKSHKISYKPPIARSSFE